MIGSPVSKIPFCIDAEFQCISLPQDPSRLHGARLANCYTIDGRCIGRLLSNHHPVVRISHAEKANCTGGGTDEDWLFSVASTLN